MYDRLRNCFRSVPADLLYYQPLFLPGRLQSHIHLHKQTQHNRKQSVFQIQNLPVPLQHHTGTEFCMLLQLPYPDLSQLLHHPLLLCAVGIRCHGLTDGKFCSAKSSHQGSRIYFCVTGSILLPCRRDLRILYKNILYRYV